MLLEELLQGVVNGKKAAAGGERIRVRDFINRQGVRGWTRKRAHSEKWCR